MADFERISELAEKKAAAGLCMNHLGAMNSATDPQKKIAQHAQYQIAQDAWWAADKAYHEAINKLTPDELNDLVHWQNQKSL